MRRFANLYLILYFLDAGLSLFDELLQFALGGAVPGITALRGINALLVLLLSIVVFTILGFDRRLPKRIFLPLTLYAFWCSVGLWPLLGMLPRATFALNAAFGQVFLSGVAVLILHHFYGGVQLPEELFARPGFTWRNTLIFSAVNLLLLPLVVVFTLMASVGVYIDQMTAGFMRMSPIGLYMVEQNYNRGGQSVRLDAMMHIARSEYYQELARSLPAAKTVILTEGVTDRDHLLTHRFDYSSVADLIGLTSQQTMPLDGNLVDLEQPDSTPRDTSKPDIFRADVDLNSFSPETVAFLNVLGRTLFGDKPLPEAMLEYNAWAEKNLKPEMIDGLRKDILVHRNAVVIDALKQSLKRYDTVVIPWGAMHMPAIEQAVLAQGFTPKERHERLSLDFRTVPYAELWQKWQEAVAGQHEASSSDLELERQ